MRRRNCRPAGIVALIAWVIAAGSTAPCLGLIVRGGSIDAPAGNAVGWWRGATGVAIGPRHVLSAKHLNGAVGEGFQLDGAWYTAVRITPHPQRDLVLIEVDRDLPAWHIIAPRVRSGSRVYVAGQGVGGGAETSAGVEWTSVREERWGMNRIDGIRRGVITIKFDSARKGLPYEAMLAHGDSGAGLFLVGGDGSLQLVGIGYSAEGDGRTRIGGRGYATDVVALRSWITQHIAP